MKIRIEASSTLKNSVTGIGYYTKSLIEVFQKLSSVSVDSFTLPVDKSDGSVTIVKGINRRTYVKLNQFSLAPVFDRRLSQVDLTIFPDYALWPTKRSRVNAVVIHDLTYIKYPQYMRMRSIGSIKIPVTSWYLSSVVKRSIKKADFIITVSKSTRDDLHDIFNIKKESIIITEIPPSGNFLSQKKKSIKKTELLKKYSIPTEEYILSVGTIEPRKNQQDILRAYLLLPQEIRKRFSLVFAGGIGWSSELFLDELSEAKERGENVILTGYFDEADSYALYSLSTLYTSASHYEGFGMPVLEAISTGTATLLSDIPVYREVTGNLSVYVDPSNKHEYASKMLDILKSPSLRDKLVSNSRAATEQYSWEKNASRIIAQTEKVLAERANNN